MVIFIIFFFTIVINTINTTSHVTITTILQLSPRGWSISVLGLNVEQSGITVTTLSKLSCSIWRRRKLPKLGQTFPHHLSLFNWYFIFLQFPFDIFSDAIWYFFRCNFSYRSICLFHTNFHFFTIDISYFFSCHLIFCQMSFDMSSVTTKKLICPYCCSLPNIESTDQTLNLFSFRTISESFSVLSSALREHLLKKKCFLSGIARMRGGGGPCPN